MISVARVLYNLLVGGLHIFNIALSSQITFKMASTTFENTVSAVSSLLHTPIVEKQDVKTELNYWAPRKNRQETVDFTQPGGELRFQELEALQDKKTVLIRDVRGNMSDYTLEKNGFQYVIHEFSGVDDWSDEEIVKTVHIPEAEKLVQKMFVTQ